MDVENQRRNASADRKYKPFPYFRRIIIMQITDVKVRKIFEEGPMKAIVSVTFDNELALHDVKVIYARDKHFVVMPSRKNPDGTYRDIVHPINAASRNMLETAVINAYFEKLREIEENPEIMAFSTASAED